MASRSKDLLRLNSTINGHQEDMGLLGSSHAVEEENAEMPPMIRFIVGLRPLHSMIW
jgi:hypothetical protein